jgi:hypothetical protein
MVIKFANLEIGCRDDVVGDYAKLGKIFLDPGTSLVEKALLLQTKLGIYDVISLPLIPIHLAKTIPGYAIRINRHRISTVLEILNKNCP